MIAAIARTPLDRIPKYDTFWEDALERWKGEGLVLPEPKYITVEGERKQIGTPQDEYFDFNSFSLLIFGVSEVVNEVFCTEV